MADQQPKPSRAPPDWLAEIVKPNGQFEGSTGEPMGWFLYLASDGLVHVDATLSPQQLRELADYVEHLQRPIEYPGWLWNDTRKCWERDGKRIYPWPAGVFTVSDQGTWLSGEYATFEEAADA
jgi:hypothetical protein